MGVLFLAGLDWWWLGVFPLEGLDWWLGLGVSLKKAIKSSMVSFGSELLDAHLDVHFWLQPMQGKDNAGFVHVVLNRSEQTQRQSQKRT